LRLGGLLVGAGEGRAEVLGSRAIAEIIPAGNPKSGGFASGFLFLGLPDGSFQKNKNALSDGSFI
jgi:hypothetical protein